MCAEQNSLNGVRLSSIEPAAVLRLFVTCGDKTKPKGLQRLIHQTSAYVQHCSSTLQPTGPHITCRVELCKLEHQTLQEHVVELRLASCPHITNVVSAGLIYRNRTVFTAGCNTKFASATSSPLTAVSAAA